MTTRKVRIWSNVGLTLGGVGTLAMMVAFAFDPDRNPLMAIAAVLAMVNVLTFKLLLMVVTASNERARKSASILGQAERRVAELREAAGIEALSDVQSDIRRVLDLVAAKPGAARTPIRDAV